MASRQPDLVELVRRSQIAEKEAVRQSLSKRLIGMPQNRRRLAEETLAALRLEVGR